MSANIRPFPPGSHPTEHAPRAACGVRRQTPLSFAPCATLSASVLHPLTRCCVWQVGMLEELLGAPYRAPPGLGINGLALPSHDQDPAGRACECQPERRRTSAQRSETATCSR